MSIPEYSLANFEVLFSYPPVSTITDSDTYIISYKNILQKESDELCIATHCTVSESDFLFTARRPEWSSGKSDQDSAQRLLCSLPAWVSFVVLAFHFESWS